MTTSVPRTEAAGGAPHARGTRTSGAHRRNRLVVGFILMAIVLVAAPTTGMGVQPSGDQVSPDQAAGSCVRPPRGLTGWWPGDGDHDDIVGGRDAVLHGDASFGPGVVDKAFVLDGDGDFVDVPDESALDVGTGNFTVDLWARFDDTTGEQILVEKWVQIFDAPSVGWTFTKLGDNSLGFFTEDGLGGGNGISSGPLNIQPGIWIHLAARKSGSTVEILMNGVVIASNPGPAEPQNLDSASSLKFGHRGSPDDTPGSQSDQGFFLNGRIDEVELTVGRALPDAEIAAIYLAGAAGKCKGVPERPSCSEPPDGLTGWWPGDRNADDIVGGRDAVLHGDATFGTGLVRGAFVLDGDGDFADVPDDPALDFGTGDFTVDLWVKFNGTGGEQILVEKWVQGFANPSTGWTLTKLEDNAIVLALASSEGEFGIGSAPIAIPSDVWLHFAAQRSGSEFGIFMNGVQIASGAVDESASFDLDTTASVKFGHRGSPEDTPGSEDERGFFLNGRIDEVELTVGRALSDEEIVDIYLAGAAGKCK